MPREVAGTQAVQIALPGVGRDDRQAAGAHDAPEQPQARQRRILLDGEDGLHGTRSVVGTGRTPGSDPVGSARGYDFLGAAARRGFAPAFLAGGAFLAVA